MRGIRGAITVEENTRQAILNATKELLQSLITENQIKENELISIFFTTTSDLNQEYPAVAARSLGLKLVPLMCFQEMNVIDSLKKCIRVLILINRNCSLNHIKHAYLKDAKKLRPDLIKENN